MSREWCRKNYGWIICLLCMWAVFCVTGMTSSAFSVHLPFMRTDYGLTNTQCSAILTVRSLTSLLTLTIVDRLIRAWDVRGCVMLGMCLAASGFFLFGVMPSFLTCCIASGLTGAAYAIGGMVTASVAINRWFISHRTFAVGLCAAGTGACQIILPPAVTILVGRLSLRATFYTEAGFILLSGIVIASFLKNRPQNTGLLPVSDAGETKKEKTTHRQEDAPKGVLHMVYLSVFILATAIYSTVPYISLLLASEGFSYREIAMLTSVYGIMLTLGKCVYGALADRFGVRTVSLTCHLLVVISLIILGLLWTPIARVLVWPGILLWGLGNPIATVALSAYAGVFSTREHYLTVLKHIQSWFALGSVLIGPVPGMIADHLGNYTTIFLIFSGATAVAMLLLGMAFYRTRINVSAVRSKQKEAS